MLRAAGRGLGAARALKNWVINIFDCPVVVLVYHRVGKLPLDPQMLTVSPDNFRRQMAVLRDSYPVLGAGEDWSSVNEPSVVVTFDDGYADNVLEALPVLQEYGIPATFFVTTGNIGTDLEYWWDDLERLVILSSRFPECFLLKDHLFGREWPTKTGEERLKMYGDLHRMMKMVDAPRRGEWMGQLRDWAGAMARGRSSHRAMSVEELKELAKSDIATIGAHTVTHTPLSAQDQLRQREEIIKSKQSLEGWLCRKITLFSYPFGGRAHYTPETARLVREAGFIKAFSNFPGQWHRLTDPYQIPRHLVRDWDGDTFIKRLKRFWVL